MSGGDSCEPKGDGNILHRHGVYPKKLSAIDSERQKNRKGPKPGRQNHLGEEGADSKREEGVPRGPFASIFTRVELGGHFLYTSIIIRTPSANRRRILVENRGSAWFPFGQDSLSC